MDVLISFIRDNRHEGKCFKENNILLPKKWYVGSNLIMRNENDGYLLARFSCSFMS